MGVLLAARYNRVNGDQDGQETRQSGLYCDEDDAGDGLGGLGDAKLLDEDEDAHDREHADDLDEDVDDVAGSSLVGTAPNEQDEH